MTQAKTYSTLPPRDKAQKIMDWLREHKARDLAALDFGANSPITEIMIIVSASSQRHARSLADGVAELCSEENYEFLRMEGYQGGVWVLADLNDIVVHVFQEHVRELYALETLWRDSARIFEGGSSPVPTNE